MYGSAFDMLGGDRTAVQCEWTRLVRVVMEDDVLRDLSNSELYARLYLHFSAFHDNVLLLAALMHAAWLYDVASLLRILPADNKAHMLLLMMGKAWQAIGACGNKTAPPIQVLVEAWSSHHVCPPTAAAV